MNRLKLLTAVLLILVAHHSFATPLTGSRTIGGTSPNYTTFAAAISDLSANGVGTGGVTFNIRSGVYPEYVEISSIAGASSSNPITFRKESGTVTVQSSTQTSLIKLNGCDFVTFDGVSVNDTSTSTSVEITDILSLHLRQLMVRVPITLRMRLSHSIAITPAAKE
ncbi:MAG: hypothetical protein OEM52_09505 [bacterium]|nr:hypothetical protein [bacterium]